MKSAKTSKCVLAYVTTKNKAQAQKIGRKLVAEGLAACINILPGMESCYRWQGKIEGAKECVLIVKTSSRRKARVLKRIQALHSYSVPCVLFLEVKGGNPAYLAWVAEN